MIPFESSLSLKKENSYLSFSLDTKIVLIIFE